KAPAGFNMTRSDFPSQPFSLNNSSTFREDLSINFELISMFLKPAASIVERVRSPAGNRETLSNWLQAFGLIVFLAILLIRLSCRSSTTSYRLNKSWGNNKNESPNCSLYLL